MKKYFFPLQIVVALILLCSCGTTQMYSGPKLSRDQVAVLSVRAPLRAEILSGSEPQHVVGSATVFSSDKVALSPGFHNVKVYLRKDSFSTDDLILNFEAIAGHKYRITHEMKYDGFLSTHGSWSAGIEDVTK